MGKHQNQAGEAQGIKLRKAAPEERIPIKNPCHQDREEETAPSRASPFPTSFLRGRGKTHSQAVDLAHESSIKLILNLQLRDSTGFAPVSPFSLPFEGLAPENEQYEVGLIVRAVENSVKQECSIIVENLKTGEIKSSRR